MYKLTKLPSGELNDYAIRLSDNALVHRELNEQYLAWLAEGNTPEPADNPQQGETP
jgi:hypothetical protein